ncbi:MAG: phosphotransferase [Ilumatobacter sp.]|uniref:phosphotransferase n=1 Tax=Ilumatobacter sp. TaxID=1967498 RepID=UPI0032994843
MNDLPPIWMRRWHTAAPSPSGPWTVTDGDDHGLLDPERGVVTVVDPADDRRLPGLAAALADGGRLVAYRHHRRAVTRDTTSFTKVVRPDRAAGIVRNHEVLVGSPGFETPRVLHATDDGRVQIETVEGPSLHGLLRADVDVPIPAVATALSALHAVSPSATVPPAEFDDPARWIAIVTRMEPARRRSLQAVADELPSVDPAGSALVHTDLHDKNVMSTRRGVHFIDLDGLAVGAPEIDVVNLAVHLELRALQAGLEAGEGRRRFENLLTAYQRRRPLDATNVSAIERHTWFRLGCLYLCRPSGRRLAHALLDRAARRAEPLPG